MKLVNEHNEKKQFLSEKEYKNQEGRALVSVEEFKKYSGNIGFYNIESIFWTSLPGSIKKYLDIDISNKEHPADIIVKFKNYPIFYDTGILGISLKSKGKKEKRITVKNIGIGTIEKDFEKMFSAPYKEAEAYFNLKHYYELELNKEKRKNQIRETEYLKNEADQQGINSIKKARDLIYDHLKTVPEEKLKQYILKNWLNVNNLDIPYVRIIGEGKEGNYTARIEDTSDNDLNYQIMYNNLKLKKIGDNTIGFKTEKEKMLVLRLKSESQHLVSSLKLIVEIT